jgi:4-amino-4-deoxy-L-arabinose transferase-like glycosyltransferase
VLKNVMGAGKTRQNPTKKRSPASRRGEHFDEDFDAVLPSAIVFQHPVNDRQPGWGRVVTWHWLLPLACLVFLMCYRLSDVAGLHRDEALFGLVADSIIDGSRPVRGYFNLYTAPIHSYIIALFFKLFGESIWTLRVNGVLANVISVVIYADLVRRLFPKQSFWFLFIIATFPPVIVMARIAQENYALNPFFLFSGIWCFYVLGIRARSGLISRIGYVLSGFLF